MNDAFELPFPQYRCPQCGKDLPLGEARMTVTCASHMQSEPVEFSVRRATDADRNGIALLCERALGETDVDVFDKTFDVLGGVPFDKIRYDNLKSAVSRMLFGRSRTESARWVAFRSHYGFHTFYCLPGIDGAHEKGGVEGEGGRFRRNHLVPVPVVASLAELNDRLRVYDQADDARRIANRTVSVGQHFEFEKALLRPLPAEAFETGLMLTPRVDRYARISVRQCHYSVPARLIGRRVRAVLRASQLLVFDGRTQVACHERAAARGSQQLQLDHYLEVLVRKPGALPGATALAQARKAKTFTATHEAFWAAGGCQIVCVSGWAGQSEKDSN